MTRRRFARIVRVAARVSFLFSLWLYDLGVRLNRKVPRW